MSEICITSSAAATRGSDVLAGRRRGRDDRVVAGHQRHDQRRDLLGEPVLELRGVGDQHLRDAIELGGGFGGGLAVGPATSTWTSPPSALAAVAPWRLPRASVGIGVLGKQQDRSSEHPGLGLELRDQLGHAADLDAGLAARRLGGLQHLEARRDVDAESSGFLTSSGFFLAFMMLGSEG